MSVGFVAQRTQKEVYPARLPTIIRNGRPLSIGMGAHFRSYRLPIFVGMRSRTMFGQLVSRTPGRGEIYTMAGNEQRLRHVAAKAARRKAIVIAKRKSEVVSDSLAGRVRVASSCPIAVSMVAAGLFDTGMGHLVLARSLPSGLLGCGFFLVDPFCLGVKDAFYAEMGREQLRSRMEAQGEFQTFVDAPPALLRKLIHDAVAYSADLGLPAAKDYVAVERIFGDIDAGNCSETFTFGKDGKPFYVTGPLDTPTRIRRISKTLQDRCGSGGWDFLVQVPNE